MPKSINQYSIESTKPKLEEHHGTRPFGLSWRSSTPFILTTVIIGLFSETFLYGIVIPLLPLLLHTRLAVPHHALQFYSSILLAAYAGCSVIASPFAGVAADATGSRKGVFMFGLGGLVIATVLFFAGQSVAVMVVARCAQGASSAFIWTAGFALCIDTVGSENLGKTLGIVMSFVNAGALTSPPLGGFVYSQTGIVGVAGLATGILFLDLTMRILLIEKRTATSHLLEISGAASQIASQPYNTVRLEAQEESCLAEEIPLLGDPDPLSAYFIPPTENGVFRMAPIFLCMRNSSLVVAIVLCGIESAVLASFDVTVPLEAQSLFKFTALEAGLLFIPVALLRMIFGPIGGWAVDRFGPKPVAVFGYSFLVPVLISFRFLQSEPRTKQIVMYNVLLALSGIGMAIVETPAFVEAGIIVERFSKRNPTLFGERGAFASLSGLSSMTFSLGMTIGPILAGGLRDVIGYGNMNGVLGGLAGLSAIASFIWLGEKHSLTRKKEGF